METINIQVQVPNTGKYSLDEFIAKVKEYAEKLSNTLSTPVKSYRETYMTRKFCVVMLGLTNVNVNNYLV